MIAVRIHTDGKDTLLAAADEDILGKTFRERDMRITVSERFYKGELVSEEVFVERMRSFTILNLTGERAVGLAVAEGYISEDSVLVIDGIKHAQAVKE
jgi:uncharacterized protein